MSRRLVTEIYVNGGWVDVSGDLYQRDDVTITRARPNESGDVSPSSFSATLRNMDDDYSPGNPMGAYWGSFGLNTPIRHSVMLMEDLFDREVSDGFGSTPDGQAYSLSGAGGTVANVDFSVNQISTITIPVANAHRIAYLPGIAYRDVDVKATFLVPINDITGSAVTFGVVLRGRSTSDYYLAQISIATTEAVSVSVVHADGTILVSPVVVTGITQTSTLVLALRAQAEGETIRVKVWNAASSEPYGWTATGNSDRILTSGWVGVRVGLTTGSTNAPLAVQVHTLIVRSMRFAGEISEIPERWDLSENDIYVPIKAAGPLRRLGQGASPLRSAMYRGLSIAPDVIAYWPLEDEAGARSFASGLPGGLPMTITPGVNANSPTFGADSGFASSSPLPSPNTTVWTGVIPIYPSSTVLQIMFLATLPVGGASELDGLSLLELQVAGTASIWKIKYSASGVGSLAVKAYSGSTLLFDGATIGSVNGVRKLYLLRLTQVGANISVLFGARDQDADPEGWSVEFSQTLASRTFVRGLNVIIDPDRVITSTVIVGHLIAESSSVNLIDRVSLLNAYSGERAGRRIERLCAEEGIDFSHRGGLDDTARMGYQRPRTFPDLVKSCAEADLGTLYETRGTAGLYYRTRASLYDQDPVAELDYDTGEVDLHAAAIRDDQLVRNDITVQREGGSSSRAIQLTGRLAAVDPLDGGIGRYDTSTTLSLMTDEQPYDIAGWLLLLGTVDEARYPRLKIDLLNHRFSAARAAACLDIDVDDYLRIVNPRARHSPNTIRQLARGFVETLNVDVHSLQINCAPESPYEVAVLNSVKIDSSSSVLTGGPHSPSATSLTVVSGATDVWTTMTGDFPFDINLEGERVAVTNITSSTSPQTFTVIRSVNGVQKQQLAGTPVRLWNRSLLAL